MYCFISGSRHLLSDTPSTAVTTRVCVSWETERWQAVCAQGTRSASTPVALHCDALLLQQFRQSAVHCFWGSQETSPVAVHCFWGSQETNLSETNPVDVQCFWGSQETNPAAVQFLRVTRDQSFWGSQETNLVWRSEGWFFHETSSCPGPVKPVACEKWVCVCLATWGTVWWWPPMMSSCLPLLSQGCSEALVPGLREDSPVQKTSHYKIMKTLAYKKKYITLIACKLSCQKRDHTVSLWRLVKTYISHCKFVNSPVKKEIGL